MTEPLPAQKLGDVRGWLCFEELLPSPLQNFEDGTMDLDRARQSTARWVRAYDPDIGQRVLYDVRPATATERLLLVELGYTLPDQLETYVHWCTETLRRRRWPQLEEGTTTP